MSTTLTESGTLTLPADARSGYFSGKSVIHTDGTFKKTENKKESTRVGNRTVTKTVKVTVQTAIAETEKIDTLLTYEASGAEPKTGEKTESPSASKSPSSSSSAASEK